MPRWNLVAWMALTMITSNVFAQEVPPPTDAEDSFGGDARARVDSAPLSPAVVPPPAYYAPPSTIGEARPVRPAVYRRSRPVPQPVQRVEWQIPAGKFGLQLIDGTKLIGVPGQSWSARLKTGFGTVTIPLGQIRTITTAGKNRVAINLKNGDRVSGELTADSIPYETKYGTLTVPADALKQLVTESVVKVTRPPARLRPNSPYRVHGELYPAPPTAPRASTGVGPVVDDEVEYETAPPLLDAPGTAPRPPASPFSVRMLDTVRR